MYNDNLEITIASSSCAHNKAFGGNDRVCDA